MLGFWLSLLSLKIHFEPFHYQTVDGDYYIQLSKKIEAGKPYYLDGLKNAKGQFFSPYPPGFPFLLFLASLPDLPIPNQLLVHGFFFLMLSLVWWWTRLPLAPLFLIFFTDTSLELATYPWSEWSFFSVSVLLIFLWEKWEKKQGFKWLFFLLLTGLLLFSIRYAAIFFLFFLGLNFFFPPKEKSRWQLVFLPGILFFLLIIIWFSVEWMVFGQVTGGDRYANQNSRGDLFNSLWLEFQNQIFWFKDLEGSSKASFFSGLAAQLVFVGLVWMFNQRNKKEEAFKYDLARRISSLFILSGICYLLFIIPLRWYFYFAEFFDLRLLGPGFLLLFLGLFTRLWVLIKPKKVFWIMTFFLLMAAFFTLPKQSIFLKMQEKIWLNTRPAFGFSNP